MEDREAQHADPHVRFWQAVVVQAWRDALTPDTSARHRWSSIASASASAVPLIRAEARAWLLDDRGDFFDVCLDAGFDPDAMRSAAKRILTNEMETRTARRIFFNAPVGAKQRTSTFVRHLLGTSQLRDRRVGATG